MMEMETVSQVQFYSIPSKIIEENSKRALAAVNTVDFALSYTHTYRGKSLHCQILAIYRCPCKNMHPILKHSD